MGCVDYSFNYVKTMRTCELIDLANNPRSLRQMDREEVEQLVEELAARLDKGDTIAY